MVMRKLLSNVKKLNDPLSALQLTIIAHCNRLQLTFARFPTLQILKKIYIQKTISFHGDEFFIDGWNRGANLQTNPLPKTVPPEISQSLLFFIV